MFERFDLQRAFAIRDFDAQAAARGERNHFVSGERALGENVEHFAAHIPGRADHGDVVTHRQLSIEISPPSTRSGNRAEALLSEKHCKHNAGGGGYSWRNQASRRALPTRYYVPRKPGTL